jgi:hypothetical protein
MGRTSFVDFRRIGTTNFHFLRETRVACLTHQTWAAFQRRYALHSIRATIDEAPWLEQTQLYWDEFRLWELWNQRGLDPAAYQEWLDQGALTDPYAGVPRRQILEFAPDFVEAEMP